MINHGSQRAHFFRFAISIMLHNIACAVQPVGSLWSQSALLGPCDLPGRTAHPASGACRTAQCTALCSNPQDTLTTLSSTCHGERPSRCAGGAVGESSQGLPAGRAGDGGGTARAGPAGAAQRAAAAAAAPASRRCEGHQAGACQRPSRCSSHCSTLLAAQGLRSSSGAWV